MSANVFDIIIIILLAWGAYSGFTKGLILSAASLLALVLGVWGAVKFSNVVANYLTQLIHINEKYIGIIAFATTFVLIVIAVHFIAKGIETLVEAVALGVFNKVFGAAFGVLKFGFIISVLLVVLNVVNKNISFLSPEFKEKSLFYKPLSSIAPSIFNYLKFDDSEYPDEEDSNSVDI
jgi:membrane protein required for colicin V production